jgi:hypothetical protein
LLLNLARQKIQEGCGVAVIDPHGTLIQSILQGNIPKEREGDVVVLDLADLEHPAPLNLLRGEKDETRIELLANALSNLFPDMDQLVQTSRYLTAALSTVQFDSDATIRDIGRLFKDDVYRGQLLRQLKPLEHVQALEAWQDYEATEKKKAQGRQAIYEPILNRISPFYSKPYILPILCHPKGLDFTTLIKQQKIILISLKMHKRATDQERDLIGALLISILQAAGMQETHAPFFIYVDEAEKFVTSSLSTLLAEARKDNLFLTLANQFTQQLSGETLQAIGGTVATNICFNCGVDDARKVKDIFAPHFEITDLINLDQFQAAIKIRYEGLAQHAFSLHTLPPPNHGLTPEQALATEQRIRARSISQYTPMSGEEVTQWLETRYRIDDEDPRYG